MPHIEVASTPLNGSFPGFGLSLLSSCLSSGLYGPVNLCPSNTKPLLGLNGIFPIILWISIEDRLKLFTVGSRFQDKQAQMSTHYCIWCLYNVCIPLYHFLPPLKFAASFQVPLYFHEGYLPKRVKVNSPAALLAITHPTTARLVVRVEINDATLCVSWMFGQRISHKNT